MPAPSASTIDRAGCLTLLATRSLGRLVFTQGALPDVLPVTYLLDGESVLLRLAIGATAAAVRGAVVAFETDDFDDRYRHGWSVTVIGRAHELTAAEDGVRASMRGLSSWSSDGRDHFFSLAVERITGHRLAVSHGPHGPHQRAPSD